MAKPTRLAALTLGLTAAHVAPLLAMDAKIELPKALFAELTSKNFKTKKAALLAGVKLAMDGKTRKGLALDEGGNGLAKLLDALEGTAEANDAEVSEEQHNAMNTAATCTPEKVIDKPAAFDAEAVKEWMRGKGATDAEMSTLFPPKPATDEDPDDKDDDEAKKKKAKEEADKKAEDAKTAKDTAMKEMKPAMDAAITTAVAAERTRAQATRVAIAEVKPWIGDVPVTMALDSAAAVFRHALTALGVAGADKLHEDALLPVLNAQPRPGPAVPTIRNPVLGMDAAAREGMKSRLVGVDLDRIGRA